MPKKPKGSKKRAGSTAGKAGKKGTKAKKSAAKKPDKQQSPIQAEETPEVLQTEGSQPETGTTEGILDKKQTPDDKLSGIPDLPAGDNGLHVTR